MGQTKKSRMHTGRYILIVLAAVLVFLAVAFFSYINDYRHADETARSLLQNNPSIRQEGDLTILTPDAENETGRGLIFYPGGKVEGMRYFMSRFGLRREEVMAFGDEENDIDMLEYAGLGVAMGNAKAAVMAAADYVTAGVDEDGIEKALRRFGL